MKTKVLFLLFAFAPLLALAQVTPEAAADDLVGRFKDAVTPFLMKLALIVGTARLILKPIVEYVRAVKGGEKPAPTWKSVLNWLLSLNVNPLKLIVLTSTLALLTSGCVSSNGGGGSTAFSPVKVEKIMTFAARTGTRARLTTHPQERPLFEAAAQALADFENTTNANIADLALILSQLPIKDLRDGDKGLALEGGLLLYDLTLGDRVDVNAALLQPVARGLRNGIVQGLGRAKFKPRRVASQNAETLKTEKLKSGQTASCFSISASQHLSFLESPPRAWSAVPFIHCPQS